MHALVRVPRFAPAPPIRARRALKGDQPLTTSPPLRSAGPS